MPNAPQRRKSTRVTVTRAVEIGPGPNEIVSTRTKDLSLKGVYVYAEKTLSPGTRCSVRLLLEGAGEGIAIEARGIVARVDPHGMGIQFDEIADTDSFTHLQNLVLLHADDADAIQLEFREGLDFSSDE